MFSVSGAVSNKIVKVTEIRKRNQVDWAQTIPFLSHFWLATCNYVWRSLDYSTLRIDNRMKILSAKRFHSRKKIRTNGYLDVEERRVRTGINHVLLMTDEAIGNHIYTHSNVWVRGQTLSTLTTGSLANHRKSLLSDLPICQENLADIVQIPLCVRSWEYLRGKKIEGMSSTVTPSSAYMLMWVGCLETILLIPSFNSITKVSVLRKSEGIENQLLWFLRDTRFPRPFSRIFISSCLRSQLLEMHRHWTSHPS